MLNGCFCLRNILTKIYISNVTDIVIEELNVDRNSINFNDKKTQSLIHEWIKDAANLDSLEKESRLQFPEIIKIKLIYGF